MQLCRSQVAEAPTAPSYPLRPKVWDLGFKGGTVKVIISVTSYKCYQEGSCLFVGSAGGLAVWASGLRSLRA